MMKISIFRAAGPAIAVLLMTSCRAATEARPGAVPPEGARSEAPASESEAPPVVHPGAPGESSRTIPSGDVRTSDRPGHSDADVHFVHGMIAHHAQALEMASLAPDRAARDDVRLLARRIDRAQRDEIALMERWLEARGEAAPPRPHGASGSHGAHGAPSAHADHDRHGEHHAHEAHGRHAPPGRDSGHVHVPEDAHMGHGAHAGTAGMLMPGMLTAEQLQALADASGEDFDRLFLEFMIFHHEGALIMVAELFASEQGGQEGEIYQFASHVDSDQRIEIDRMRRMLNAGR